MQLLKNLIHYYYGQKCTYTRSKKKYTGTIVAIAGDQVLCEATRSNRKTALRLSEITLVLYPLHHAANYRRELDKIFDGEFSARIFLQGIITQQHLPGAWKFHKITRAINFLRSKGIDCDGLINAGAAVERKGEQGGRGQTVKV